MILSRMAKMLYYIAESINVEGCSFAYHFIKRYETFVGAESYLHMMLNEWSEKEGLRVKTVRQDYGDLWGVMAMNDDYDVIHNMYIVATPLFMAGGEEGL